MNITLRKLKIIPSMSEETTCYTAEILLDGVMVATASNRGHGGSDDYHFKNQAVAKQVYDYVKGLPPLECPQFGVGYKLPMTMELFIGQLVEKIDHEKKVAAQKKRWCKTKTVFRLKGDKPGEYLTINHVFTPAVKKHLTDKYGDKLEEIVNETI